MLTWPPGLPGPSLPAKRVTIEGRVGMRCSTGGRVPAFTLSMNIGVSCIFGSASALTKRGASRATVDAAVKKRLLILDLAPVLLRHSLAASFGFGAGDFDQFGP